MAALVHASAMAGSSSPDLHEMVRGDDRARRQFGWRRPGAGAGRRRGFRGIGGGGAPAPILSFASGTFTRSTDGWYHPDAVSQASVGPNVLRTLDKPDGVAPPLTLLEGPRTNLVARSSQFHNPLWVKSAGVTVDPNVATGPDGTASADRLTFTALAANQMSQAYLGATPDNNITQLSIWLRTEAGTKDLRLRLVRKDGTTADHPITVTTTWQRFAHAGVSLSVAAGVPQPQFVLLNDAAGTAGSVLAWQAQAESDTSAGMRSRHASSVIATTGDGSATRGTDSLTWAAGAYDIERFNRRWAFVFAPYWVMGGAATEGSGQQLDLISFGGVQHYVALSGTNQILAVQGGVARVTKAAISANRFQRITIIVDPVAGTLEVQGAATGNGVAVGAPWVWPSGQALRIGGRSGAGSEPFGAYGEPYAA